MVLQKIDEEDINFFAKEVARKLCSANKQNAVIMTTGAMGSGKSWTMLELARLISIYVAERLGGKPEQYFNIKDNLGIMTMDEIAAVYEHMDKNHHCIYIIDDAGATFNSRRFTSDNNIAQNDRIQTMRPHSNCVIFTTPQKSLMDKVVRNLSGYMIFMKDPMYEVEMTCCDIRRIQIDLASDKEKVYRKYLQNHRGDKYKLHMFHAPPKDWTEEYDRRRAIAEKKLADKSRETVERANELKKAKPKKTDIYKEHLQKFNEGFFGDKSLRQTCIENGLPYQSVLNMKAEIDIKQ
jgi:hypothetical protein